MGQYHYTVNLDKREFIHPHKLGSGLKSWEQIGGSGGTSDALFILLVCPDSRGGGDIRSTCTEGIVGRWHGDRVVVVGDYAEPGDLAHIGVDASAIYDACGEGEYVDITDLLIPEVEHHCGVRISGDGWRDRTSA